MLDQFPIESNAISHSKDNSKAHGWIIFYDRFTREWGNHKCVDNF